VTRGDGVEQRHGFSFGVHYDPDDVSFGLLLASNDDVLAPGCGFDPHRHRDVEIVTWVLSGSLAHSEHPGGEAAPPARTATVRPGVVQHLGAGSGVVHAERNASADSPVRLVQMWVAPDRAGLPPVYGQVDVTDRLGSGGLVPVASGLPRHGGGTAVLRIRQEHAALHAGRLPPGATAALPPAPYVHLYVAGGTLVLDGPGALGEGDAARVSGGGRRRVTAGARGAEVLVWEMHATLPAA